MDGNSEDLFLQNLEEYVFDEDKIVTYKWLSKTLKIHVNQAKQLLYTFCSEKSKASLVSATYLLAGKLRATGENHLTVVGQDKYEDAKSAFDSLTSEHVYSVQKTKKTPSASTLYTVDSQSVEEKEDSLNGLGAIRCKFSVRRAAEEMALLRITVPLSSAAAPSKPSQPAKPPSSKELEKVSPVKSTTDDNNCEETIGKGSKAKGGLAAMFAAQTSKAPAKTSAPSTSKNNAKNQKGGISNFFSKVSKLERSENDKKEIKDDTTSKTTEKDKPMDVVSVENASKSSSPVKEDEKTDSGSKKRIASDSKKTCVETKSKPSSKASKREIQKKRSTKEKKDDGKKRRRIVEQESDSSDDDMFSEEVNASSRESSPVPVLQAKALESDEDEEVIPPTPGAETSNGRSRRKRKVVKDKTFMDDDGYVVTQKVTEYESYSESDSETSDAKRKRKKETPTTTSNGNNNKPVSPSKINNDKKQKKAPNKVSPPKNKTPTKNKQQSLMSFFKKKE